ncbi:MAG: OmpA family protein [Microcella sp.]|uniref:OmpA family protein n=1 Tax=Microcella sp. TaxID=1913979 RepID=UPI00331533E3
MLAPTYCPRPRRAGVAALVAALAATVLTGCITGDEGDEVALVAGVRTGSPAIPSSAVRGAMELIDADQDRVVVVSVEGAPRVVFDHRIEGLPTNTLDRGDDLEALGVIVENAVLEAASLTEEADVAEAIALAAAALDPTARSRTVVVLDSMLGTAGALSMLGGALDDEAEERVRALVEAGAVPDLRGVRVEISRLGVTVAPQDELTASTREGLRAQWEHFLRTAGAEVVIGSDSQSAQAWALESLPHVTPVPVTRSEAVASCRAELPDSIIAFGPDTAEFVDSRSARETIAQISLALQECEGVVSVSGSTASAGSERSSQRLSEQRARVVATLLAVELDVDLDSIEVRGYGTTWPCRVDDLDAAGQLVEERAQQNRVVVISRGLDGERCP